MRNLHNASASMSVAFNIMQKVHVECCESARAMKMFSSVLLLVLVQQCVHVCNGQLNTTNTTDDDDG